MIFVTSLHDTASKRKDQEQREKKQPKSFDMLLQEACADTHNEISYTANGYTKDGAAFHHFEKRREYAYK